MLLRHSAPSLVDALLGTTFWRVSAALLPPQPLASTSQSSCSTECVNQHGDMLDNCLHAPSPSLIKLQQHSTHQRQLPHSCWPQHLLQHTASYSSSIRPTAQVVPKLPALTPLSRRLGVDPDSTTSSSNNSSSSSAVAKFKSYADFSAHPPTEVHGPLLIRYPNHTDYYTDREVIIQDTEGTPLGISTLDGNVFNVPVRLDILQRVVRFLRAAWQQGTHSSKNRSEVRGGGRKPRPQKGTGMSRQGSIRSPLWVGGGVAHGPRPRSHAHKCPRAILMMALRCALSAKGNEGRLVVVDTLMPPNLAAATGSDRHLILKEAVAALTAGLPGSSTLLVDTSAERRAADGGLALRKAATMRDVEVMAETELTVYHLLKYQILVITEPAVRALCDRLSAPHHISKPVRYQWWMQQQAAIKAAADELKAGEEEV